MNRSEFIKTATIAGGGLWALGNLAPFSWADEIISTGMAYSTLGRTGAQVSKIGIGTGPFGRNFMTPADVDAVVARAIDEGINYFDVAPNYSKGESERRMGSALQGKREKAFLVSKTEDPSYEGTWRLLRQSLEHMRTDYLDLVHIHNFGHERRFPDIDFVFSDQGAMAALREAKQKGMVRFIGASGHVHPSRFHYAIDSGEIDVLMLAVNYINQHTYDFEHKIWMRAGMKDIGLVSMKMFGGAKGSAFKVPSEDYEIAMRYTLSLPKLATAVIGIGAMEHLEKALQTFRRTKPLDEAEFIAVSQRGLDLIKSDSKWQAAHGLPLT